MHTILSLCRLSYRLILSVWWPQEYQIQSSLCADAHQQALAIAPLAVDSYNEVARQHSLQGVCLIPLLKQSLINLLHSQDSANMRYYVNSKLIKVFPLLYADMELAAAARWWHAHGWHKQLSRMQVVTSRCHQHCEVCLAGCSRQW